MKLSIKNIQHYPIGGENALRVKTDRTNIIHSIKGILEDHLFITDFDTPIKTEYCKPVFRPMSDLYKPCLKGGAIPIVELAKIAIPSYNWLLDEDNERAITPHPDTGNFSYEDGYFESSDGWDAWNTPNQLKLFEYLFQYHFDVFGLIGKGLAININEIEK